jgi:hypothetical protein
MNIEGIIAFSVHILASGAPPLDSCQARNRYRGTLFLLRSCSRRYLATPLSKDEDILPSKCFLRSPSISPSFSGLRV